MSKSMREALEKMVARFSLYLGPNEIHAGQHDKALIAEARAALSSPVPKRLSEDVVRKIIVSLRQEEDDPERPAHSERKAGWHAAVDRFEEDLNDIIDRLSRQPEVNRAARYFLDVALTEGHVVSRAMRDAAEKLAAALGSELTPARQPEAEPAAAPADAERLALAERIERAHQVSIVETDQQRRLGAQSTLRPAETAMLVSSLRAGGWREDMQS